MPKAWNELRVLHLVGERLEGAGVAYMLTGSLALTLYAQPRMTRDVDLVVELAPADARRIAELFAGDFLVNEAEISRAIAGRGMFNLIHSEAIVKVDCILRKQNAFALEEFRRRRPMELEGWTVWTVSREDLILAKLMWAAAGGSAAQMRDVQALAAEPAALDLDYLREWAAKLAITEPLAAALRGHSHG